MELQEKYRNIQIASIARQLGNLYDPGQASRQDSLILDLEMRMLKFMSLTLAVAGLLTAGEGEGRGCSVATLKGTYGSIVTGTRPSGPPPAPLEQMIGVALTHFDGLGHLTGTDNIHGSISGLAPDRPATGTYTMNEDCTGTMTRVITGAPPLELRFVVVDKGKEIRAAVMSPATVMVTSIGRRI